MVRLTRSRMHSRVLWSLGSQALSSATSFIPLFLVLHFEAPATVGAFGLAYTTYFFLVSVVRGLALEPLVVRFSGGPPDELRSESSRAVGLALATSVALGVPTAVGFAFVDGAIGHLFVALGLVLPLLLLNDALRHVFFASGLPKGACLNDGLFLITEIALLICVATVRDLDAATLIVSWGAAGGIAAGTAMWRLRLQPAVTQAGRWLADQRDLGLAFAADHAVARGAEQAAFVITGALGGLATLGAVSACRTMFAPISTVQAGVNAFALPEASRLVREGRLTDWRHLVLSVAVAVGILMAATGALLGLLPESWGTALFHENWEPLREVLFPTTVSLVLNGIAFSLWLGMRSRHYARATFVARASAGLLTVAAVAVGTSTGGASGATWGLAIGSGYLCLFFSYYLFGRSTDDLDRTQGQSDPMRS